MIIHQRVLHFQIESPEECQRNAVVFANQLLTWLPCSRLACLYILCRKDKSFLYFYGEKMIPEYDLEASGTNTYISSLCFLCMLSHFRHVDSYLCPNLSGTSPSTLADEGQVVRGCESPIQGSLLSWAVILVPPHPCSSPLFLTLTNLWDTQK